MATVFAFVGIGLAVWATGLLSGRNTQTVYSHPAPVERQIHDVTQPQSHDYLPLANSADVDRAMNNLEMKVPSQARSDNGLKSLGQEAIRSLAKAASLSIRPYLLGSFQEYQNSVKALGGDSPESRSLWDAQKQQFAMRPVSINGVRVVLFARNGVKNSLEERLSSSNKYDVAIGNANTTMTPGRYPSVASYRKKKMNVYEVRLPIKALAFKAPDNEINAEIGVALAWDSAARSWQPVEYIVYQPARATNSPTIMGISY